MKKFKQYDRRTLGDLHITAEEHTVPCDHPQHWHTYYEIEIIISGAGKYIINDVAYDISQGRIFLLTPTDFHYLIIKEETHLINISFDSEAKDIALPASPFFEEAKRAYSVNADIGSRILSASRLLIHECESHGECRYELLKYLLCAILGKKIATAKANGEHSRGIRRAIEYTALHFREPLRLSDIAAEAGYNPSYFSEIFRRTTGERWIEYLTRLRIGYAKMMLSGGFSVSDAGALSGFGSRSAFLDAFRRATGMSPAEYKHRTVLIDNNI